MNRPFLLSILAAAPVLFSQALPRISVSAPDAALVVGETVQLKVTVRDAAGNVLPNPAVTWTSQQPNLLRVDSRGAATAIGVGNCNIVASSSGFTANSQFQCIPARIDLKPSEADMLVGDRLTFAATALDAAGNAIPNVTFNWQVTGANGGQINAARIDTNGNFTAAGTGLITVRARIDVSGGNFAGRLQWIWGAATVRIKPKQFYNVRRLIGSEEVGHSFPIRSLGRAAAINDSGQAAIVASLGGMAGALLATDRAGTRLVLQAGTPLLGGLIDSPDLPSINNQGDILTRFWINQGGGALALQTRDGISYPWVNGESFSGVNSLSANLITSGSLNDHGQFVFRGTYTDSFTNRNHTGLFRQSDRQIELLVADDVPLPGLSGTNFTFNQFGIDNRGVVYFLAATPTAQGLYRISLSGQPTRLLPAARTIQLNSFVVARDGGVAVAADVDGRLQLFRIRDEQTSAIDVSNIGTIYSATDASGVLYNGCGNAGCSLMRWKDTAPTPLLTVGRLAPNGEPVQSISAASMSAAGVLTIQVSTPGAPLYIFQQRGTEFSKILQAGDLLNADANIHLVPSSALLHTAAAGPLYLGLGQPASLFTYEGGVLVPRLIHGDSLADGVPFGSQILASQSGGVFVHGSGSVYRYDNNGIQTFLPNGLKLPGGLTSLGNTVRVSDTKGNLVVAADIAPPGAARTTAYYRFDGATFSEILRLRVPTSNGLTFDQVNAIYLDESGRVAFNGRLTGQTQDSAYVFSNGRVERFLPAGRMEVAGVSYSNFALRAGRGNRFYGFANVPGGSDQAIIEHAGERWEATFGNQNSMPDGSSNNGIGAWDANANGDVVFLTQSATPLALNVRTASGELRQVLSFLEPTPAGDYIRSITDIDFRNDGSIYFMASETTGRFAIYVAEPVQ